MQKTIHTCDICGKEHDEKDLIGLELKKNYGSLSIKGVGNYFGYRVDVCRECLEKHGFIIDPKEDGPIDAGNANRKTLEDMFLDILEYFGV